MLTTPAATDAARSHVFNTSSAFFVENQGQWPDTSIKYAYNGQGINIGFTDTGPVLELLRASPPRAAVDAASSDALSRLTANPPNGQRSRITMSFDGARPVTPQGVDRSATSFNYLVGRESRHRSNVAGYQKILYRGLYDGIDLLTWGKRDGLKYEFHVAPNADWRKIHVNYAGSAGLTLAPDGSLHIATPLGNLLEAAPILYQMVDGNRVAVPGQFVLLDAHTYGFALTGAYDPSRELVIDPDLAWATYLGASGSEIGNGIAVDGSGNAYVAGFTDSAGWATAGSFDTSYNISGDAFVAKLSASGSSLLYMTYLGGSGSDVALGVKVDGAGNAYVTGYTQSAGWATAGAYDTSFNGVRDAFVAKLSASGSSLLYATYLGGSGSDSSNGIALDGAGSAYVTGYTQSAGWATAGAYNTSYNGGVANGNEDVFVARLSASGSSLLYATYLGGSSPDIGRGIAVDGAGNAYVTGETASAGWTTAGYDISYNGGIEVFVAKLSATGSSLLYATYLGASGADYGYGIAVDGAGNAYATGYTQSAEWATPGSYDAGYSGGFDAFVVRLSASGSSLLYATYLGGTDNDRGYGIAVDGAGNAYVTGETSSAGWATAGAYDMTYNGAPDPFVAKLSASGSSLLYATYLAGSGDDYGRGIAVNALGNAYVTGNTQSGGWATAGAYDAGYNGGNDAFVVQFSGLVELFPGDTNGDGKVDFQDLVALAQNYGASGKTRAQGDVNGDGNVDFQDLVILAQNYGNSLLPAAPLAPAARPEQLEDDLPPPPFSAPAPASGALPALVSTLGPRARRVRSLMNRGAICFSGGGAIRPLEARNRAPTPEGAGHPPFISASRSPRRSP